MFLCHGGEKRLAAICRSRGGLLTHGHESPPRRRGCACGLVSHGAAFDFESRRQRKIETIDLHEPNLQVFLSIPKRLDLERGRSSQTKLGILRASRKRLAERDYGCRGSSTL